MNNSSDRRQAKDSAISGEISNLDASMNEEHFKKPKTINEMMKDISSMSLQNASPINLTLKSSKGKGATREQSPKSRGKSDEAKQSRIGSKVADSRRITSALHKIRDVSEQFKQNKTKFCVPLGIASARELEIQFEQARQDKLAAKNKNKKKP